MLKPLILILLLSFSYCVKAQIEIKDPSNKLIDFYGMKTELGLEFGLIRQGSRYFESRVIGNSDNTNQIPNYMTAGVLFDFHAPNSVLGFASGINFVNYYATFTFDNNVEDDIQSTGINIPVLVKMKTGKSSTKTRLILFGGPLFNVLGSSSTSFEVNPIETTSLTLRTGIGLEWKAFEDEENEDGIYGKISVNIYSDLPRDYFSNAYKEELYNISSFGAPPFDMMQLNFTIRFQISI